jgi:hypothetical protein
LLYKIDHQLLLERYLLGETSSLVKEFNPEFGTNCKENGKEKQKVFNGQM